MISSISAISTTPLKFGRVSLYETNMQKDFKPLDYLLTWTGKSGKSWSMYVHAYVDGEDKAELDSVGQDLYQAVLKDKGRKFKNNPQVKTVHETVARLLAKIPSWEIEELGKHYRENPPDKSRTQGVQTD